MSVKGFKLSNGNIVKYDYSSLDNIVTDATLSVQGVAADAKAVGDAILQGSGSGLTEEIKQALLQIADKVAYIDTNGDDYYQDLYDALYPPTPATGISLSPSTLAFGVLNTTQQITATLTPSGAISVISWVSSDTSVATVSSSGLVTSVDEGTATITATANGHSATCGVTVEVATLSSISCVHTQSGTVYDTDSLDSLKTDLVVTAHWSNNTTSTVASTDYTLSGTLAEGTSTVTVTYSGKTTTFTVTVTTAPIPVSYLYNWDLTNSLIDTVTGQTATTTGTFTEGTGVVFSGSEKYLNFGTCYARGRTYEIDVASFGTAVGSTKHRRLLCFGTGNNTSSGAAGLIWRASTSIGWRFYTGSAWDSTQLTDSTQVTIFDGKTVKLYLDEDGYATVSYKTIGADDSTYTLLGTSTSAFNDNSSWVAVIGGSGTDSLANATISGFRVYEGNTPPTPTPTPTPTEYLYNWDLTQSLVDSVESQEITLSVNGVQNPPTRDSNGLHFTAETQCAYLGQISPVGKTFEIDVSNFDFKGNTSYHIRFLSNAQYNTSNSKGLGSVIWRKDTNQGWTSYGWSSSTGTGLKWSSSLWNSNLAGNSSAVLNAFSGKTVKVVYHSDGHTKDLYLDSDYVGTISDVYFNNDGSTHLSDKIYIAGLLSKMANSGDQCYDMTITGIRIYETEEES